MSIQHSWFSQFCKQHDIYGIEVGLENVSDTDLAWPIDTFFKNGYSNDPETLTDHERMLYTTSLKVFKYFSFPVIHYTMQRMMGISKERGWMPIMSKTWFCYFPIYIPFRGLVPCGQCITCKIAIKSGFGWRIPKTTLFVKKARKVKKAFAKGF